MSDRVDTAFAAIAAATPNRVAIVDGEGQQTYGQLWRDARIAAATLRRRGMRPGDAVAVIAHGGRSSVLAILAILVAGGHYVPVDPTFPAPRTTRMLALAGVTVVVHATDVVVPESDLPTYPIDALLGDGADLLDPAERPAEELAYVMFTSGSTGEPKPVGVTHIGITGLALRPGPLRLRADDGVLLHSTLAFDASTFEIWSALLVGARVVAAPHQVAALHEIAALISRPEVTVAWLTAPVFGLMAAHHRDALSRLRLLVAGGDVVPADLAAAVSAGCPDTVLLNGYGPTENTTFSTAFVAAEWDRTESESLPIGRAVAGTRCYLLDDRLRPVPAGQVGELCLGGDRLAWGYLGDPAATAARFRPDPFVGSPGARMYRTGDRARELPGGSLQFLGRLDDEVKVRGFRVTLGAAEAVLAEDTEVADVVVLATGTGADRVLVGFVRPSTVDVSALRARAWQRAPRHLVPDTIRALDAFPLGANGKVDRDALLADVADPSHDHNDGNGHGTPLAEIWQRRTGVVAEPDADFFVSGGSSLDLMRMIEDIRTGIQVDLDFAEVYATTSFTELADLINTRRRPAASD